MSLTKYKTKRDFTKTKEPKPKKKSKQAKHLRFVVQRHAASRLHFDFRLEHKGVLKSWPIPKGPSMDPDEKRLAIMVEDHPLEYAKFEGEIPEGSYGAGTVEIWDEGIFYYPGMKDASREENEKKFAHGLQKGHILFVVEGKKLNGEFSLVRFNTENKNTWLLIKGKDEFSQSDTIEAEKIIKPEKKKKRKAKAPAKSQLTKIAKSVKAPKRNVRKPDPMLAKLIKEPFDDKDWLYEIKYDGFRAIAQIDNGKVDLYSRNKKSFNETFPEIVEDLEQIPFSATFDGEVVVLNEEGISEFSLIREYKKGVGELVFYVFDILALDGYDLRKVPLVKRKKILKKVLPKLDRVEYTDHIEEIGKEFFKLAKKEKLEGIIGKRKESIYEQGKRTGEWVKVKSTKKSKVYIAGFTKHSSQKNAIGSLALARKKKGKFEFAGHVGTGFSQKLRIQLFDLLSKETRAKAPFKETPEVLQNPIWVKPQYQCTVSYTEKTKTGSFRHPVFEGLEGIELEKYKTKKEPENVHAKFHISHPDKIFFPRKKYTKQDLITYYMEMADYILPYLKDRPMSLNRFPDGVNGESFFQKDAPDYLPKWIKTKTITSKSTGKKTRYILCQDKATLAYIVNMGSIELNPWNSRVGNLNKPDFLIFDLDPKGIGFKAVVKTAQTIHKILETIEVRHIVKTSGKRGLHIYVPLGAKYTYKQGLDFAKIIAQLTHVKIPSITSLHRSPQKRNRKVYIDIYQNSKGQTIASPYSVRPTATATVSTPLRWREVTTSLDPKKFTIETAIKRTKRMGDLWSIILNRGINIDTALKKIKKVM